MSENKELFKQFLSFLIEKDNVKLSPVMKVFMNIPLDEENFKSIDDQSVGRILKILPENEGLSFLNKVIVKNPDFINTISGNNIAMIIVGLPENDRLNFLNEVIVKNPIFFNTITIYNIFSIIDNLPENEQLNFFKKVIKKNKNFFDSIDGYSFTSMLNNLSGNVRLNFLNNVIVKKQNFGDIITTNHNFGRTLDILPKNKKSLFINYLTKKEDFINKINQYILYRILLSSRRPIAIFKRLPKEKKDLIKFIDNKRSINYLIVESENKESIDKLLKHYNLI